MVALVVQPIAETAILAVPKPWSLIPDEWRKELGFWVLVDAIKAQEKVILYGPPTDIEWMISAEPAEVRATQLRHDCEECADARERAARELEAGRMDSVGFVQFTQRYVYDVRNMPTKFAVTGEFARADVDLGSEGAG